MEIEPADEGVLSADDRDRLNALPPLNIYRLLAIVPRALVPWTDLVAAVYGARLEPRLREIAICRQARTARAGYELHQHRLIARNNGVTDSELEAILGEPVVQSLDEHANLVCRAADEMETTATLSDETLGSLVTWLGEAPTTDLILALSVYCAVARFTNATRASIEVGDPLSNVSNPGLH